MKETVTTIFIGESITICRATFPPYDTGWEYVKGSPFPNSPFRALFNIKKQRAPVFGKVPSDVIWVDLPECDYYSGKYRNKKVRMVFCDRFGKQNKFLGTKVPAILKYEDKVKNLTLERDYWANQWWDLSELLSGLNLQDLADQRLIRTVKLAKEIRNNIYTFGSMQDYLMKKKEG